MTAKGRNAEKARQAQAANPLNHPDVKALQTASYSLMDALSLMPYELDVERAECLELVEATEAAARAYVASNRTLADAFAHDTALLNATRFLQHYAQ